MDSGYDIALRKFLRLGSTQVQSRLGVSFRVEADRKREGRDLHGFPQRPLALQCSMLTYLSAR